eukprot:4109002-Pyramimonas_sp.AAC.1
MNAHEANIWSANQSGNPLHRSEKLSSGLGLIYGALFGFRALHDSTRVCRHGSVKGDIERTLRHWVADGVVVRVMEYGLRKANPPGAFGGASKGGISSTI